MKVGSPAPPVVTGESLVPILEMSIAVAKEKRPVVTSDIKKRRSPVVNKVPGGLKVIDRDGYYRIAKDWQEAGELAKLLLAHHNSVLTMNGFEAAKWKLSEEAVNGTSVCN